MASVEGKVMEVVEAKEYAAPSVKDSGIRGVKTVVENVEQAEGVGARVRRSIGGGKIRNLDPFLLLDHFKVAPPAGFPDHPHRGFETVTYMLDGATVHEDFCGHKGTINTGDLQWMTAGRGIVHCEMPASKKTNEGLQLWVNLRSKDKMTEPKYQELLSKDIPKVKHAGVVASVIAGEAFGVKSGVYTRQPVSYLDFKMEPKSSLVQAIKSSYNSFAYIISGSASFGPASKSVAVKQAHTVVFTREEGQEAVRVQAGDDGCRLVIISGEPVAEPIVQHGPFVMNTEIEIMQAIRDYQTGKNGFERAPGWSSAAAKAM